MRTHFSRQRAALTHLDRFLLCVVLFSGPCLGAARGQSYEVLQAFSAEGGSPQGSLLRTADGKLYGTSSQGGFAGQGSVFVLTPDGGGFTFDTLHEFNGVDGATPYSNLIQGTDGNLYGMTSRDGSTGRGTFFQITPSGTLTTLHNFVFPEGNYSHAGLIQATDGNIYGTAQFGGTFEYGTVFRISPSGSVTTLHSFSNGADGRYPYAGLLQATDGNFYGTTQAGGPSDSGTIFKMTPSGTLTTLHNFSSSEGAHSQASLIQDSNGDLWGTTRDGPGVFGLGTVFKITLSGILTTLYSFSFENGAFPYAGLIQGADGSFFGTTQSGGPNGRGTVFRITSTGSLTTLHAFGSGAGADPYAGVIQDADGNLYGTTNSGASAPGTVFRLSGSGTLDTLHTFAHSDIRNPYSDLIQASDGNFYGTTFSGGVGGFGGYGTVFKMTSSGALTILHNFVNTDGSHPRAGLIEATDRNFYGTTQYGGASGNGTVFQMTPSGTLTTFHSFAGSDGAGPNAALVQATDGNFYGTTQYGGASGNGTIFQMTPSGTLTTFHNFAGSDGANPYAGLIQASDGNLYGTTPYGGLNFSGTVFSVTLFGDLTVRHNFVGGGAGAYPYAAVIQATDGNFYGTTTGGGANGRGTSFKLILSGVFTTLHNFEFSEGDFLFSRLLQGEDGNFYGTAGAGGANGGYGTVFKMTPAGNLTVLHSFAGGSDGSQPSAGLTETADGDFYGTASSGTNVGGEGGGVIFRLSPCARPIAVAEGSASICSGSSTPLTGSGGVSCSWSPSTGLSDAASCSPTASPSATTTYTLTVTDADGCASTNRPTVMVTVNSLPTVTITPSGPTTFCAGGSVTLTASSGSSYLWSTFATTQAISVSTSGSYTVSVTDVNGCFATSDPTTVTVNPRPTAFASGTATIVAGSSTALTGSGGSSCSWSPATGLSSANTCLTTASPAATTTYTLTVTDANGCISTNNPTVTVTVLSATQTPTPTPTPSRTQTNTRTNTPTPTPSRTPTNTRTQTSTRTTTNTPTQTFTRTPSWTPTNTPTPRELTALSPANVWVGLKNSDDVGLNLDLLAEVFVNTIRVGQGHLDNVSAGGSGFNGAILDSMAFNLTPVPFNFHDALRIRVSARRTCSGAGHVSGTATLWYDGRRIDTGSARDAGSRFDATLSGSNVDYYLRKTFNLSATAGTSRTSIDKYVDSSAPCPGRPFTAFGTWSITP
jgi:uncharacterized repeat protein (TIGR03803 family)